MCACERPLETQHQQPHVKKGGAAMQTPTSRKVSPSTFITNKVRLPLIAMMSAVLLIISFAVSHDRVGPVIDEHENLPTRAVALRLDRRQL